MSSMKSSGESVCGSSETKKSQGEVADVARSGRHSLSQSLHNLFHRKKSYSLKHGSSDKKKKLYELINISHDTDSKSRAAGLTRESSKARVWSVRNSTSRSPVENCELRATNQYIAKDVVEKSKEVQIPVRRSVKNNACSHSFDVLGSVKDYLKVNEEGGVINASNGNLTDLLEEVDVSNSIDTNQKDFLGPDFRRSRLSSLSSSNCYSDTSFGCNIPFCPCHGNDKKSLYSTDSREELDTSYWDLRLPSESPTYQDCQYSGFAARRYSLSTSAECRTAYGTPDSRSVYLARRRLSDQAAVHSRRTWQDKLLSAMNSRSPLPSTKSRSISFDDFVSRQYARACGSCRNSPSHDSRRSHSKIGRSSSLSSEIKKPVLSKTTKSNVNKDSKGKKHEHRSRSAESSNRRRLYNYRQRHSSLHLDADFDFSDIESSEESESTHEPKETSSESQQPSSCNDFSSCSMSSGNEPNTPDVVKRSVIVSHIREDETLKKSFGESVYEGGPIDQTLRNEVDIKDSLNIEEMHMIESFVCGMIDSEIQSLVTNLSKFMVDCNSVVFDTNSGIRDESKEELCDVSDDSELLNTQDVNNEAAEITSTETANPENTNNALEFNGLHDNNVLEMRQECSAVDVDRQDINGTDDKNETSKLCSDDVQDSNKSGSVVQIVESNNVLNESKMCDEPTETGDINEVFSCLFRQPADNHQTSTSVTMLDCKVQTEHRVAIICDDLQKESDKNFPNSGTVSGIYQNNVEQTDEGTDVDQGMYDLETPEKDGVSRFTIDAGDCEGINQEYTANNSKSEDLKQLEEEYTSDVKVSFEKQTSSAKMELEEKGDMECVHSAKEPELEPVNVSAEKLTDDKQIETVENRTTAKCLATKLIGSKHEEKSADTEPVKVTDNGTSYTNLSTKSLISNNEKKQKQNDNDELEIGNVLMVFDTVPHNDNTSVESDQDEQETEESVRMVEKEAVVDCQLPSDYLDYKNATLPKKLAENVCDRSINKPIEQENGNTDNAFKKPSKHLAKAKSLDVLNSVSYQEIYEVDHEMSDESVQVEDGERLQFHRASIDEILLNSGLSDTANSDKTDLVFEAINKEASKDENKDKDMMVMFLVGGELKVLRRSGTSVVGNHGEFRQNDIPSMTRKDLSHHNGNGDYFQSQSKSYVNRGRPKSAIIVTRSQSFNGMANQHVSMGMRRDGPQAVVLGESFRHHRGPPMQSARASPGTRGAVGFSFKKSPKVPKVPRPNRALLMFQCVKRGIREFIEATKEDIDQLQHRETDGTSTAQGKLHETDKQMKSAERYLKRLEFHLAKLDELHEYYLLQQQLREGVRTMHRAYVTSPGNQRHTLSNVKYGYKECTQNMCSIEAQLEAMMGTFNCKLKGMAGFARLCPGDVFEVTVRHGTQKWKTKGRIEKTGNQKWDIPEFNFKAVVGDIFNIKGLEVRAFKSVLLGQKSCETKDLFSANPQLMTVSINVNGSLKLSIVITWNPLDGVDENFTFVEAPGRAQGTPRRRPVSVIALNGEYDDMPDRRQTMPSTIQQTKDDNFILRTNPPVSHTHNNNVTSYHGLDSPHVSARLSDHLPEAYRQTGPLFSQTSHYAQAGFHSSPVFPVSGESDSSMQLTHPPTQNNVFKNSMPSVMGNLHFPSVLSHVNSSSKDDEHSVLNIEDVLHNLSSSLEDYHGQYTELQKLEELVKLAQKLIRKQFRSSSRSSSISVSIESALEAFDFLDTEDTIGEPQSPTDNTKPCFDDMLCSPESTAKTGDSGIESLAQRLSEDTQLGSSLGSSPVPPSTGNEEVDQCLMYHLTYCERLLENLGAFGPLKCREIYALDKIQKQCTIVENLLKFAKSGSQVDLHSVMTGICEDKTLREFWTKCTDQTSLYIHPERLITVLEQKYNSVIAEKYMIDPVKVCQHVVTRILDIPDYEAEKEQSWFVMTLHQFMLYFAEEGGLGHVEDVAIEMKLVEKLTSGNPDIVIKAILTLRESLPSSPCLKVIGMLLVTMDTEVEQCTISYLNLIQRKKESRDKAMVTFVEGLEDRTPEIRSGACVALSILEAIESIDQLVYLWQSDMSNAVQKRAKDALLALGVEGRKAFEEAQLSKHGFQGIQVHK